MSKNSALEFPQALVLSAERLVQSYVSWQGLSRKVLGANLKCPPGQQSSCCRIHQSLDRMLANLTPQATALEDWLIEAGRIEKKIVSLSQDTADELIIIKRKDTLYSFQRFSSGWWEMIGRFSGVDTSAAEAIV